MKKNYGLDMQGPFRIERVAALPVWDADDLGREVYLTTNNKKYRGNNSVWAEVDVDKIWTSQDAAPTGWSIMAGTTDALLATKGGATYTTGDAQAGTWTQPTHTHTGGAHTHTGPAHTHTGGSHALSIAEMPAHNHRVTRIFLESGIHAFHSGVGTTPQPVNTEMTGGGGSHDHGATSSAGTGATGSANPTTGSNGTPNTYRPTANVGILIERT